MHKKGRMRFLVVILAVALCFTPFLPQAEAAALQEGEFDLAIDLHAPQHVAPGSNYVVNLAYSNPGTLASPEDTQITVTLPVGVQFVSASDMEGVDFPPDEITVGALVWTVGSLPPCECIQHILITLQVDEDLPEATELTVLADISSSTEEANVDNNSAIVTSVVCDMAQSRKQVNVSEAMPGDVLTYTIELRLAQRSGINAMQQRTVTMIDTLPAENQVRFLGWVGPHIGIMEGNQLRWQGQVRAGEPLLLQYRLGIEGEVSPGAKITNQARLQWDGMQLSLDPVTTSVTLPPDAQMIGPLGYTWQHANGFTLRVPPNAVNETTRFHFRPLFDDEDPVGPPGNAFAHHAFELTAFHFGEMHQFNQPITVEIKLKPEEIAGLNRQTLRLWYRNGPGDPWAMLGGLVWVADDTLSFQTNHFTEFALFGIGGYTLHLPIIRQ